MRRGSPASILFLACAACSEGAGRPPAFPDAQEKVDFGVLDAPAPDARSDAGFEPSDIEVTDFGPRPAYPFTGIFSILNDQTRLFAREINGRLSILVGDVPYAYVGTIGADGMLDLHAPDLERSGCQVARLSGYYERAAAALFLTHESCTIQGQPLVASLRGGFDADFEPSFSGIYRITIQVTDPGNGCFLGTLDPTEATWGFQLTTLANRMWIHTAHDIAAQTIYGGNYELNQLSFSTLETIFAAPSAADGSMRGQFARASANDPPTVTGIRTVFDPARQCSYGARFSGVRIADL